MVGASMVALGDLETGRPFGTGMVLPMDRAVPVWGTGEAGGRVVVTFGGQQHQSPIEPDGTWRVGLTRMDASAKGRELSVTSGNDEIVLRNVLVGEVWLCSGQSNMDFRLSQAVGGREEAKLAVEFPEIRLMNLTGVGTGGRVYNAVERQRLTPDSFFEGKWEAASEASASEFSAVGWWAGRTIHEERGVPIGLIDISVGGSGAEAWLPREVLEARAEYAELLGIQWFESEKIGAWARGRVKLNLGEDTAANHPFRPGFLFESGVRWWRDFPFTGVLWYQGETNAEIHDDAWNERLITDLVHGWRKVLAQPELRWVMVQLPQIGGNDPLRQWWPEFQAVQASAAKKLKGVVLVETKDLGWDSPNVHPPDKRPVGVRVGQRTRP